MCASSLKPCTTHSNDNYQHIIISYNIEISFSYLRQLDDRLIKEERERGERNGWNKMREQFALSYLATYVMSR